MGTEQSGHARRCLAMMLANRGVQVSGGGAWLAVPPAPRARAKEARLACAASPACKPLLPVLRWYSSWRCHQTPVSCVPWGLGRAIGKCPRGCQAHGHTWNRCGAQRHPRTQTHACPADLAYWWPPRGYETSSASSPSGARIARRIGSHMARTPRAKAHLASARPHEG